MQKWKELLTSSHGKYAVEHLPHIAQKTLLKGWCLYGSTKARFDLFPFSRQLSLYGFKRITQGRDKGAYYHELYLRGKPFLACWILPLKVKGTKIRAFPSPEIEPNFYAMPYVNASNFSPIESLSLPSKQNVDLEKQAFPFCRWFFLHLCSGYLFRVLQKWGGMYKAQTSMKVVSG